MNKKIGINYLLNLSYQILSLCIPLIVTPYISRVIGVDGIGQYSFTYSIMRYFWLLSSLGITTFGIREIGRLKDNIIERTKKFYEIMVIKIVLAVPIIILYFLLSIFLFNNSELYLLESFYLFSVMISITWFYQGIEKYVGLTIKNFVIKILSVILIFIIVKSESDLWKYVLILSISFFLGDLSMWISVKKELCPISFKEIRPFSSFNISQILLLFIPTISAQIFAIVDKSLIGWITNSDYQNGIYEQAYKIINMGLTIITSLSLVKVPSMTRKITENDFQSVKSMMIDSLNFVWFLGLPILIGLASISSLFVPVFFGPGYEEVIFLLYILSGLILFGGFHQAIGCQYLIPANRQNAYSICLGIGGLLNVILTIILVIFFEAKGAAFSSLIGEFITFILCFLILKKDKIICFKDFGFSSWKYIFSSLVMGVIVFFLSRALEINVYLNLVISVSSGIVIYFALLLLLHEKNIYRLFKKLIRKRN